MPATEKLVNNNANVGAGFAPVSVSGYTGVGGQFASSFYTDATKPADSLFRFFCIDLAQYASTGPNSYTAGVLNDDELRKLYDVAYPNKTTEDFWNGSQTSVSATRSNHGAHKLAIWSITELAPHRWQSVGHDNRIRAIQAATCPQTVPQFAHFQRPQAR